MSLIAFVAQWVGTNIYTIPVALIGAVVAALVGNWRARHGASKSTGYFGTGLLATLGTIVGVMVMGVSFLDTENHAVSILAGVSPLTTGLLFAAAAFYNRDSSRLHMLLVAVGVFVLGGIPVLYDILQNG